MTEKSVNSSANGFLLEMARCRMMSPQIMSRTMICSGILSMSRR